MIDLKCIIVGTQVPCLPRVAWGRRDQWQIPSYESNPLPRTRVIEVEASPRLNLIGRLQYTLTQRRSRSGKSRYQNLAGKQSRTLVRYFTTTSLTLMQLLHLPVSGHSDMDKSRT